MVEPDPPNRSATKSPAFSLLSVAQVIQNDDRNLLQSQLSGSEKPAAAGDDSVVGVHQDWVVKPKGVDAGSDLGDLRFRVSPRIASERDQLLDWAQLDGPVP
jgi:hypothetical protein